MNHPTDSNLPDLVIFDFDGTLADTTAGILDTYSRAIAELGAPPRSSAECRATIGVPLHEGFRMLYPDFSEAEIENAVAVYRRVYLEHKDEIPPVLYPGVAKTLRLLHDRGLTLSVASSRSRWSLDEMLARLGITDLFALVLGGDDVEHAKPDPEPVLTTLARLSVATERAVVVGDMPVDIAMGRGAGCRTVGVSYGNSSAEALRRAGASCVIGRFTALPDAIC